MKMAHVRILTKTALQTLKKNSYVLEKQNINKNRTHYQTQYFYRANECRSYFPLSKNLHYKTLFKVTPCLNTSFKRNLSKNSIPAQENLKELPLENETFTQHFEGLKTAYTDILYDISHGKLSEWCAQLLIEVHETCGLSWWASIVLTAFLVRTFVILPFSTKQFQLIGKLDIIGCKMKEEEANLIKEMQILCKTHGLPKDIADKTIKETLLNKWKSNVDKEKCPPVSFLTVMVIQTPMWLALTTATNNLSNNEIYKELTVGGFSWIMNLTEVDSTMTLPISLCLINFAIIQVHSLFRLREYKLTVWILRLIAIVEAVILSYCSAAANIYCLTSSLYGLLLSFVFNSRLVYVLLQVPIKDTKLEYPHRLFYNNIRSRLHQTNK